MTNSRTRIHLNCRFDKQSTLHWKIEKIWQNYQTLQILVRCNLCFDQIDSSMIIASVNDTLKNSNCLWFRVPYRFYSFPSMCSISCISWASHQPLLTNCFSPTFSHNPISTNCFSSTSSHQPLPTNHFSLTASHQPLLTNHFSPTISHQPLLTNLFLPPNFHQLLLINLFSPTASH